MACLCKGRVFLNLCPIFFSRSSTFHRLHGLHRLQRLRLRQLSFRQLRIYWLRVRYCMLIVLSGLLCAFLICSIC